MYSTAGSEPATRFVGKIHRIKRWFPLPRATHFQNLPENTLTILNLSNVGRRNSYCLKYNRASTKTCVSNKKVVYSNVYVYASQTLWNSESKINYGVRSKKYWFWASDSGRVLFSNPGTSFLFFFLSHWHVYYFIFLSRNISVVFLSLLMNLLLFIYPALSFTTTPPTQCHKYTAVIHYERST